MTKPSLITTRSLLEVHETAMRSRQGRNSLVWNWYWIADEFTTSPYYAKFLQAKANLLGSSRGSAVIAIRADYDVDRAKATKALKNFLLHCLSLKENLRNLDK
jgi:EpsI family protein